MALDARHIGSIAVALLAYLLGVLHFGHLAWGLLRSSSSWRGSIRAWVAKVRVWALGSGQRRESQLNTKIRSLIERERTKCMQTFAQPFAHFAALVLISKMLMDAVAVLTAAESSAILRRFEPTAVSRVAEVLPLLALCELAAMLPKFLTPPVTAAVFVLTCVLQTAKTLLLLPLNHALVEQPFAHGILIVLGIVVNNSRLTVPCTLVVRLATAVFPYLDARQALEGDVLFGMQDYVLTLHAAIAVGQCVLLIWLERAIWAASREILEGKATLKMGRTARSIISALCDAVVTLGPDLRINKRAPKLANLLLRVSAARALEGTSFTDLLLESDKARFRSFLERTLHAEDEDEGSDEPTPAQALQVSLRDGTGTGVRVQLFHGRFRDEDDEIGHLLGVCEVGDPQGQDACAGCDARREEPGRVRGLVARAGAGSDTDSGSESSSTLGGISVTSRRARKAAAVAAAARAGRRAAGSGTAGSASHGPLKSAEEPGDEHAPAPWQLLQPGECGVAFESLRFQVGDQRRAVLPAIDASLADNDSLLLWVAEWSSCRAWLQDLTNAALRPIRAASWRDTSNPPAFVRLSVAFQATCALPPDFLDRHLDGVSSQGAPGPGRAEARGPPMRLQLDDVKLFKNTRGASRAAERSRGPQRRSQPATVHPAVIGAAGPRSSGSSTLQSRSSTPENPAAAACLESGGEGAVTSSECRVLCPHVCL